MLQALFCPKTSEVIPKDDTARNNGEKLDDNGIPKKKQNLTSIN